MTKPKVIFFGNGPLASAAFPIIYKHCDIIFHAKTKEDLETVKKLKLENPDTFGILASFGVIIKQDLLDLFEPTGILNIHPSLLPKYRGPSPIETAILNGDKDFGVSVMKLVKEMDAGPIYYQTTVENTAIGPVAEFKLELYRKLAETGATWIVNSLEHLPAPTPQNKQNATFTKKLDTSMSTLDPAKKSASELLNEIRAFYKFPKSKYTFYGLECTIIDAHVATEPEANTLSLHCYDNSYLIIDKLQPASRKIMDAKSFINGYAF